jgi:tRNA1Val (adenine37-N6)-methyltransferase
MAKSTLFRFKQFSVAQQHAAMKVGTDGVLLGAWAGEDLPCARILDVGTGTGLIALMMAQRFPHALIDAIDISEQSAEQALYNFAQSPWHSRIQLFHASLQEWVVSAGRHYDLLVCNPPFYANGWQVDDPGRNLARRAEHLPPDQLASAARQLLSDEGVWWVIVPEREKSRWIQAASGFGWHLRSIVHAYTKRDDMAERSLLAFDKSAAPTREYAVSLFEGGAHSEAYIRLVRDFYLKM